MSARENAPVALFGVVFGAVFSRAGFSSWDEVHAMFTFSSLRLMLGFGIAVTVLAVAWVVISRVTGVTWPPRAIHRGTLGGALLFGAGWALSGACPSVALVQIGEGQLGAIATLAGIFGGNWLYAVMHERYFRWSQLSCADV